MSDHTEIAIMMDRLMRNIQSDLNGKADQFDTHKVGPLGGMVLLTIADLQPISQNALAATLTRDKSQVTRLLHGLETKGLVEKNTSPNDARSISISLTALGTSAAEGLQDALSDTIASMSTDLDADEIKILAGLLSRMGPN